MNKEQFYNEIKTYKFLANKSLGQNFLINPRVCEDIANLIKPSADDNILEIGAGLGSLSYFLVNREANITLIDVDENMVNALKAKSVFAKANIKRENILKADISKYNKIVGNLPYYITTGIIEYILLNGTNLVKATFMVQKEVYQKLIDKNEISPLTLLLRHVCTISNGVTINRNNFTPVPHVDSTYFLLTFNEFIKNEENKDVYRFMTKMFLHRRKTILNNLSTYLSSKEKSSMLLDELNVIYSTRPEQLDIEFYFNLLKLLKSNDLYL